MMSKSHIIPKIKVSANSDDNKDDEAISTQEVVDNLSQLVGMFLPVARFPLSHLVALRCVDKICSVVLSRSSRLCVGR